MPIFQKDDRRIYFCHIPKTAGSHVYLMFVANGWELKNYSFSPKRGTSKDLKDRFGVTEVAIEGDTSQVATSLQHATYQGWKDWGPFESSFAITRNPVKRYISAVRYRYGLVRNREETLAEFRSMVLKKLQKKLSEKPKVFDGHFISQTEFIAPNTDLFQFEGDWEAGLMQAYDLKPIEGTITNASKAERFELNQAELSWVQTKYADDFARLNYAFP
ncbi:MAG: sulfotransferase family 2 domain-containing protein [Pseudoruegeria sp.]